MFHPPKVSDFFCKYLPKSIDVEPFWPPNGGVIRRLVFEIDQLIVKEK